MVVKLNVNFMKLRDYFRVFTVPAVLFLFVATGMAQNGRPPIERRQDQPGPIVNQPQDNRANSLRQLGLSRQQTQQIRGINVQRRPLMEQAQRRFREANRALDEAIYADQVNETEFQARLKEFQLAQAVVVKIRFMNEFAVRRVLTPEQLTRFRDLRRRFEQRRENFENRRSVNRTVGPD